MYRKRMKSYYFDNGIPMKIDIPEEIIDDVRLIDAANS